MDFEVSIQQWMTKDKLRGTNQFHWVNPIELEAIEEFTEYLEAILHNACSVWEEDNELELIDITVLVKRLEGLKLEIYPNEHPPPHFHVKSPNINASFRIDNCTLLHGKVSRKDYKKIEFWYKHSRSKLNEIWHSTRPTDCQVSNFRA